MTFSQGLFTLFKQKSQNDTFFLRENPACALHIKNPCFQSQDHISSVSTDVDGEHQKGRAGLEHMHSPYMPYTTYTRWGCYPYLMERKRAGVSRIYRLSPWSAGVKCSVQKCCLLSLRAQYVTPPHPPGILFLCSLQRVCFEVEITFYTSLFVLCRSDGGIGATVGSPIHSQEVSF